MYPNKPIKSLFLSHATWQQYLAKYLGNIRDIVVESVTKMLNCATSAYGSRLYCCDNKDCSHTKYIHHTCKSRACSSCGVKSSEQWIQEQIHVLPDCHWQHITFTMPSTLWGIFKHNRFLLNELFKCAANILLNWAKREGISIGIFCALHTYGRKLNWNTHIHLSVTRGGIDNKTGEWKDIFFKKENTEACWRSAVCKLLEKHYDKLTLPRPDCPFNRNINDWKNFLSSQYNRHWRVHFNKKTKNHRKTITYLGRYLKRPPISSTRLKHYAEGAQVTLEYLNHRNKKSETLTLEKEEFIDRVTAHIPEKHFKMLRYYGILSNRTRGEMLPKVYEALDNKKEEKPKKPTYATMLKNYVKVDPFECILCSSRMVYSNFRKGESIKSLIFKDLRAGKLKQCMLA